MKRRDDQADSAAVDVAKGMATNLSIRRTNVCAGGTTNAAQRLFETWVGPHLTTTIINKQNVHLFFRRSRSCNECRITGYMLSGRATRKQAQLCDGLGKGAD